MGETLPLPLVVAVFDSLGNPVQGAPIVWSARGDSAIVRTLTDGNGNTSIAWQLGPAAGEQEVEVRIDGDGEIVSAASMSSPEGVSGRSTVLRARARPARAHRILVSHSSLDLQVGENVVVTATVVDRYGNVIPDAVIEWRSDNPAIASVGVPAPVGVRSAQ